MSDVQTDAEALCTAPLSAEAYGCCLDGTGICGCTTLDGGAVDCVHVHACGCSTGTTCQSLFEGADASPDWTAVCR